ncbi:MAG: hypothetical protein PHC34_11835 [Candidatus Gastranaerophilales bacterium]|nr:hypothetical protein [Candidatus Gastranaerophilales bacterium]
MSICDELHEFLNTLHRFGFSFNEKQIPLNGIYILFEKGEISHNSDRIVRIGTHTGINQLIARLKQHYINENKDRSIFRKNIGRCILNKCNDPYLQTWNIDFTPKETRVKFKHLIDVNYQKSIERQISSHIRENFTFCILPIDNKEQRLDLESKIISTVSNCSECKPSQSWFGLYSPKDKIRSSGLWLVNKLDSTQLCKADLEHIKSIVDSSNGVPKCFN